MGVHDGHRKRMRQRFLSSGLEGFADHEVLELLLYYVIRQQNTNPPAHALLERYGSLSAVLEAPMEDLKKVKGVGEESATLLHLVSQVSRRARLADAWEQALNSTDQVGSYLLELFAGLRRERLYQLCLDQKGKLIACKLLSEGNANSAGLNIRLLVENAILTSASQVILAHNHPSGVALPSQDDFNTTEQARTALETIGVKLRDHVIVADGDYVSMADSGFLAEP